jgi:hypothetical protein
LDLAQIGIRSPEALLARQLASQRTAFAITGGGPIQSDLFPVLEYAAPRALYLGDNSRMLEKFDERTRQQLLAPADKLAILQSLPPEQVQSIFSEFTTINSELFVSVRGLAPAATVPCVFNTNSPRTTIPALPADSPTNTANLTRAATLIGGTIQQRREGIALIESAVEAQSSSTNRLVADWVALAATAALSLGDLEPAGRLAALALKRDPTDAQAAYVARIVERERQSRQAADSHSAR